MKPSSWCKHLNIQKNQSGTTVVTVPSIIVLPKVPVTFDARHQYMEGTVNETVINNLVENFFYLTRQISASMYVSSQ